MESHYIEIDGLRAHYLVAGEGEPVLLLPGFAASAAMSSEAILKPLARRFRVYGLDLPGCGDAGKPPIQYGFELGVRCLAGFLDALSLETVNVIGLSQGGLIGLGLTLNHSHRVNKLVLVASAGIGHDVSPFIRLLSLPVIGEVFAAPRLYFLKVLLRRTYRNPNAVDIDQMAREFYRVMHSPGARNALLCALRSGMDLRGLKRHLVMKERLASIKAPTLIVWGENDPVIPLAHAYTAHQLIEGSRLHVFPNSGHDPSHENADEFIQLVEEFLDGTDGRGAASRIGQPPILNAAQEPAP